MIVYLDTETSGLDDRIHELLEVAWVREDREVPNRIVVPHTLAVYEEDALTVNNYRDRRLWDRSTWCDETRIAALRVDLTGSMVCAANVGFDLNFLTNLYPDRPWHHRPFDIQPYCAAVLGWDSPASMRDIRNAFVDLGYSIPEPDHTAAGDVLTLRALHAAARDVRRAFSVHEPLKGGEVEPA